MDPIWEFPKIGDPNIVPVNGRILIIRTPKINVPENFGNPQILNPIRSHTRPLNEPSTEAGNPYEALRLRVDPAADDQCLGDFHDLALVLKEPLKEPTKEPIKEPCLGAPDFQKSFRV